jgi:ribosome-associated translation inhibitor RaiA
MNIQEMIEEKAKELAQKHADFIESECNLVCEKYNCSGEDLIIKYISNVRIEIDVKASRFAIDNQFICDGKIIK